MEQFKLSVFQATMRGQSGAARLNWLDMAADQASAEGARLLVCPELYLAGLSTSGSDAHAAAEYVAQLADIAALHQISILGTGIESDGDVAFNTAFLADSSGEITYRHRKVHLTEEEAENFRPGRDFTVVSIDGWRIGVLLGRDLEFPESARHAAFEGAEMLIVPAALTEDRMFIADKMAPVRAFENRLFVVLANWSGSAGRQTFGGGSRIIAPDGTEDQVAGKGELLLSAVFDKHRLFVAREEINYVDRLRPV